MELVGTIAKANGNIEVYDDFAHHPTAIETNADGAKKRFGCRKIWAIIEPRSNTMKLQTSVITCPISKHADEVIWYQPPILIINSQCDYMLKISSLCGKGRMISSVMWLVIVGEDVDAIIIMSNGGFEGIHPRFWWQTLQHQS